MFSDTKFWRLVWKEYRTQLPLWLALLIATPLMQVGMLILRFVDNGFGIRAYTTETANGLMAIGFIASIVYLLGCCATMFSVEHETGVFDFQRVLPTNQPRVFWAKLSFAAVSSLLLTAIQWLVTRGVFLWDAPQGSTWFGTYGLLYMAEIFAWSILASLVVRQPLWGVIAAIVWQSLMMQLVLPYLTSGRNDGFHLLNEDARFTLSRFVVLALLFVADVVLGRLWFEDRLRLPRWQFRWKPDFSPSYPSDVELPPYVGQRQIGWSRMLWLSWRDGRWVMGGFLAWYGYWFLNLRHANNWEMLMLPAFIGSFVFGLFAFAPEQWSGRFHYLTERGCWPRLVWLSRQVLWILPILLMCAGTLWKRKLENDAHPHAANHAAFDVMMAAVMPWVCYSAGQLAAMLFRSTAMAIGVGMGLCLVGGMWGGLMSSWLAPTWWSVGLLPAIALFVTWLRANDWVEERRDRVSRRRLVLGLGVPIALLLATCATYRVLQIPVAKLPTEWDKESRVLARLTPSEKETLDIYRRAMDVIERGETQLETYADRSARLKQEHADWTDLQVHAEAFEGFHRDWAQQHVAVVPLLREAHRQPAVPLALVEAELPARASEDWNPERIPKMSMLMIRQPEHSLKNGDLDATWDDILIAFELVRRSDMRAIPVNRLFVGRTSASHEGWLLTTVVKWGRHKDQTRDRILLAIRKLEEIAADHTSIRHSVHHEFLQAQKMMKLDEAWEKYVEQNRRSYRPWYEETAFVRVVWQAMFWERWRSDRVIRWQSSLALERSDLLGRLLKSHRPLPLYSMSANRNSTLARAIEYAPEERVKLLELGNYDHNTEEATLIRTSLVPPNMQLSASFVAESEFLKRAESFRATILLLALADFHREQGRYPESLAELTPTYFAEAPRDPKSAGPFVYFPHGVPEDVTHDAGGRGETQVIVRKETPFLVTTYGRGQPHAQQKSDGGWQFTDYSGKSMTLDAALATAYIWLIEPPQSSSE
ncbi:MAG: hypothetical protein IAG10_05770 [Planctomycetaceae bacterium]|nr:hypothetical protein [Planctomycetaceae bacterium]